MTITVSKVGDVIFLVAYKHEDILCLKPLLKIHINDHVFMLSTVSLEIPVSTAECRNLAQM